MTKKQCAHCEKRPRLNSIGSLCAWCWQHVPNLYNSQPHRLTECPLDCKNAQLTATRVT
jgi:hypothetical protein